MKMFYLFYGSDVGIINREVDNIRIKIGNCDIIYYDISNISDIVNEASTIGMFSLNKFIVIDCNSYFSKRDIDISLLEDYFDSYNSNSYLVFVCNSDSIDSRKKLVSLIKKHGIVKKLEVSDSYISSYINSYLSDNGYSISDSDIMYLVNRIGNDINNITNEIDKLMLYKINDKIITRSDIDLLTIDNIDDSVYDLVSAIIKNDSKRGILLYNNFINNGIDVNQLVSLISSQIRLLYQVKRLYNKGKSNEEIAKILEFKSVYRVKYLLSDSYYYSEDDLLGYLSKLCSIDEAIKSSQDGNMLFELFIVNKNIDNI